MALNLAKETLERYGMQAALLSVCAFWRTFLCVSIPCPGRVALLWMLQFVLVLRKQLVVASTANICESYLNWEICCTEWQNSHFEWHNCQLLDRGLLWIWRNCHSGEDVQGWVNELYKNMGIFVEILCQCILWFPRLLHRYKRTRPLDQLVSSNCSPVEMA